MLNDISVIMPVYLLPDNNRELTGWTLRAIGAWRQQSRDMVSIVVVDNGSMVDSDLIRQAADAYIDIKENLGYSVAVNTGIVVAERWSDWLIVAHNDAFPKAGCLDEMLFSAAEKNSGAVCATAGLGEKIPTIVSPSKVETAIWLTHRDIVSKVGLLDDGYGIGVHECVAYFNSMEKCGYTIKEAGSCEHIGGGTWDKLPYRMRHEYAVESRKRFGTHGYNGA